MRQHRKAPSHVSSRRKPVIGLVLGSGSARGLAHIGVIKAMEELRLPVHVIAGTSIGAFIGAVYAAGRLSSLEAAFRGFDWKKIGSMFDPVFPRSGLISGRKISHFIHSYIPQQTIDELPIPFCAVATDMKSGEEVLMDEGELIQAIRASISFPGILTPVHLGNRLLVDGGLVNPVPVNAARALGADIVIAVDLNHVLVGGKAMQRGVYRSNRQKSVLARFGGRNYERAAARIQQALQASQSPVVARIRTRFSKKPIPGLIEVLLSSLHIMQARIAESRLQIEKPDLLIRPSLSSVHFLEFDRADELIKMGYRSAIGPIRELARQLL